MSLWKMPLIRPTFRKVTVVVKHHLTRPNGFLRTDGVIKAEEGVTVGHLFDYLEKDEIVKDVLSKNGSCSFGLICGEEGCYVL